MWVETHDGQMVNLDAVSLIDVQQVGNSFEVCAWFIRNGEFEHSEYKALAHFTDRRAAEEALNEFKRLFPRQTLISFPTGRAEETPARGAISPS